VVVAQLVERQFVALKVVGSSPTHHPRMQAVTFFQKNKVKKKIFKKKHHLIDATAYLSLGNYYTELKNLFCWNQYKVTCTANKNPLQGSIPLWVNGGGQPISIFLTQKLNNPKSTICTYKNLNTFSVGSIIKYFKIKQSKCLRRGSKGLKIFLNFLKNVFEKKYLTKSVRYVIYSISGFDYSLLPNRKGIRQFLGNNRLGVYVLCNLKVSFTKKRDKKIKSIKKRLKKKMLLNFLKKVNI
jgi:hypothetical protein